MSIRQNLEVVDNDAITLLVQDVIQVGELPTGTIEINDNGEFNVTPYAAANVNVPLIKHNIAPLHKDVAAYISFINGVNEYHTSALESRTTDIYEVLKDHVYMLFAGVNFGDRNVSGIYSIDPYGSVGAVYAVENVSNVLKVTTPQANAFKAPITGYYAVFLSISDQHPNSYLFDVTDLY